MKLKIKLPGRSTTTGQVPTDLLDGDPVPAPVPKVRKFTLRKLLNWAAWGAGGFFVFVVFVWLNLPTEAIAWRMSHELKKRGMVVSIDDISVSPFGKVKLHDVTWNFRASRPGQSPVPFYVEEADAKVKVLNFLLFDELDFKFDAELDEGTVHAEYDQEKDETQILLSVQDLPMYGVPKLQSTLNAPLLGMVGLETDLVLPGGEWEKASGQIVFSCSGCSIGDGVEKLYIPGVKGFKEGVTVPQIVLGEMTGNINVKDGIAIAEEFESKSDDITLLVNGGMKFKDPFQTSQLEFQLEVLVEESVMEESDRLRLAISTAKTKAQMDKPKEDWLGFKLRGNVDHPRFMGIKQKTKEERIRESRENRRDRNAERKKEKAARDKKREADKKKRQEERDKKKAESDAKRDKEEDEASDGGSNADDERESDRDSERDEEPENDEEEGGEEEGDEEEPTDEDEEEDEEADEEDDSEADEEAAEDEPQGDPSIIQ